MWCVVALHSLPIMWESKVVCDWPDRVYEMIRLHLILVIMNYFVSVFYLRICIQFWHTRAVYSRWCYSLFWACSYSKVKSEVKFFITCTIVARATPLLPLWNLLSCCSQVRINFFPSPVGFLKENKIIRYTPS